MHMANIHKSRIAEEQSKAKQFLMKHSDIFKLILKGDEGGIKNKNRSIGDYTLDMKTKAKTKLDL